MLSVQGLECIQARAVGQVEVEQDGVDMSLGKPLRTGPQRCVVFDFNRFANLAQPRDDEQCVRITVFDQQNSQALGHGCRPLAISLLIVCPPAASEA